MNLELFDGAAPPPPPATRAVRPQRPGVAEQKALLSWELWRACRRVPATVCAGSVQLTREWSAVQRRALRTLNSPSASRRNLQKNIDALKAFTEPTKPENHT